MANPYQTPQSDVQATGFADSEIIGYAGFWIRVGAALIDVILITAITLPLLWGIYGAEYFESTEILMGPADFIINYVFPAIAVIWFWSAKSATPGKMLLRLKIRNEQGEDPSLGQYIGRYFAYFVAVIPLMLGILWVAWDEKKQGFHDKLARTIVVKTQRRA